MIITVKISVQETIISKSRLSVKNAYYNIILSRSRLSVKEILIKVILSAYDVFLSRSKGVSERDISGSKRE